MDVTSARHPAYLGLERGKGIFLHPGVSEAPGGLYLVAAKGDPILEIDFVLI